MQGADTADALLAWADVATSARLVPLCKRAILGGYHVFVNALHNYLYKPRLQTPSAGSIANA